ISHAIANNAWLIGSTAAMTGPLGGFGVENQKGVKAALEQINSKGGVHDRPIHMEVLDDAYVPTRSVENIKVLAANPQVIGLMACLGTANNAAITPLIESAGLVHLAPLTGASSLRKNGLRHVFHIRASYSDEIQRLVQNVASMGIKNLAVVYTDNPYGKEVSEETMTLLKAAGVSVLGSSALAVDGKNLDAVVAQIVGMNPSAVVLGTAGGSTTGLVAALRKASPSMPIAGISPTFTQEGIAKLGSSARGVAITMVFPEPNRSKHQLVREYQAAMRATGLERFTTGSLEGYIDMRVMAEALQRAGKGADREKLRQAIAGIRNFDLGGFQIDYSNTTARVASKFVDLGIMSGDGRVLS
ncbi:ABC transporter substrate-binding protein, partial [Polaromonas sp.]|uniref:ABC transporter substrate-binding protein n=1 Tax=Polaromonas sp. TaxID=1869339 RepID=UPI003264112E